MNAAIETLTLTTGASIVPLVWVIFVLTYAALAIGKVPGLRMDRAGISLVGAAAMLACGALNLHEAAPLSITRRSCCCSP